MEKKIEQKVEEKKSCTNCKESKNVSEFYLKNGKPRPTCMTCDRIEASKNWRKKHPLQEKEEKIKEGDAVYIGKDQRIHKVPTAREEIETMQSPDKIETVLSSIMLLLILAHIGVGMVNTFYIFKTF